MTKQIYAFSAWACLLKWLQLIAYRENEAKKHTFLLIKIAS